MSSEIIFIVKDSLDSGFEANAVGFSIFTEAEDMETLKKNIIEATDCHFEKENKPKLIRIHYIKEEVIAA